MLGASAQKEHWKAKGPQELGACHPELQCPGGRELRARRPGSSWEKESGQEPRGCVLSSGCLFCSLDVLLPVLMGASGQQGVRVKSQRWPELSGPSEDPPRPHP